MSTSRALPPDEGFQETWAVQASSQMSSPARNNPLFALPDHEISPQQPAQECLERIEASTGLHDDETAGQGYDPAPGMKQGLSAL